LKAVLSGEVISPIDIMRQAVYTERYDLIAEALKPLV
jgi:hypothetical protein